MTRRGSRPAGESLVWLSGGAVSVIMLIMVVLLLVVLHRGLGAFWPQRLALVTLRDGTRLLGELQTREPLPEDPLAHRLQFKIGNRDLYGLDFRWIDESAIRSLTYPDDAVLLERREFGNFHGFLAEVRTPELAGAGTGRTWETFRDALRAARARLEAIEPRTEELSEMAWRMEQVRLKQQKLAYEGAAPDDPRMAALAARLAAMTEEFERHNARLTEELVRLRRNVAVFADPGGTEKEVALVDVVRAARPNLLGLPARLGLYLARLGELFVGEPRESNTEGGLFPAIFGTVMLVFVMSLFCIPLGVVAAVYLREYAREGLLVRMVRIAVYNLAGVPSIVYGVFGLGFFIYGLGGTIDQWFFPERLPTPTFGTGGLLWASLTLSLLTVPIVIVTTEEALAAIPRGTREGSLSLGATQFQTLVRVLLPMASPGIMTGFILAMARAAGEVAPLMITGVVKLAPTLPIDGYFPFVHLERKFMHLGFHIYDVGFQSPNVEASKPMVFMTTLLLLGVILLLSAAAIYLRGRMARRMRSAAF